MGELWEFKNLNISKFENSFFKKIKTISIWFSSFLWIALEFILSSFSGKLLATYKRAVWKNLTIVSVKIFGLKSPLASLRFFCFFLPTTIWNFQGFRVSSIHQKHSQNLQVSAGHETNRGSQFSRIWESGAGGNRLDGERF